MLHSSVVLRLSVLQLLANAKLFSRRERQCNRDAFRLPARLMLSVCKRLLLLAGQLLPNVIVTLPMRLAREKRKLEDMLHGITECVLPMQEIMLTTCAI